jgi:hypothetical protein
VNRACLAPSGQRPQQGCYALVEAAAKNSFNVWTIIASAMRSGAQADTASTAAKNLSNGAARLAMLIAALQASPELVGNRAAGFEAGAQLIIAGIRAARNPSPPDHSKTRNSLEDARLFLVSMVGYAAFS